MSKSDILALINKTAIVYFILAIMLNYTPLRFLNIYGTRLVENKFFPGLIYRFIGIEGTPAGADIFYLIVFISNLISNKSKNRYFLYDFEYNNFGLEFKFSAVVSIVGAIMIMPFTNNKIMKSIYSGMLWLYQYYSYFSL